MNSHKHVTANTVLYIITVCSADITGTCTLAILGRRRRGQVPVLSRSVSELHRVRVCIEGEHPVEVAHVVAHAVGIACIDQELDTVLQERREKCCAVVHAVALEEECLVDLHVAA